MVQVLLSELLVLSLTEDKDVMSMLKISILSDTITDILSLLHKASMDLVWIQELIRE